MSEAASTPDPAAADSAGEPSRPGSWPGEGRPCLSEDDLLALLDGLGVAGTHDPEEDQEAIAEAEWEALRARDDDAIDSQDSGHDGAGVRQGRGADGEGRVVSPVLIGEHLPAGPGLAAMLAQDLPGLASDWDLPGLAAGYRRVAAWAQARELDAAAEIAARRAAANPRIGVTGQGRPASLPPEAAAEIGLELAMSQPGASAWTVLGCRLRWDLPGTGAALAAGAIDLPRARIIAEATAWLTAEQAARVEARVLPAAGGQTTGQLRAAARRAVLAIDPDGAEQRRRDTERNARICLYPGEEGTATLTGSCLPGIEAAAAMARITAMARALKSSGANGGLDLLRAHVYLGLLLGTRPLIPPPPDGPPANPPPAGAPPYNPPPGNDQPADHGPSGHPGPVSGAPDDSPAPDDSSGPIPDGGGAGAPADPAPEGSPGGRVPGSGGPDDSSPARGGGLAPAAPGGGYPPGSDLSPRGEQGPVDEADLPGWWPDIPPPGDADAPPSDGDPPDPVPAAGHPDGDDGDDWPQLPPPDWPPLPAHLPAVPGAPPGPAGDSGPSESSLLARTGLLDVLIPWTALTGHSREPAILGRIGPVSSWQARQLLALATRSPATQWRVILTSDDGRALAVTRARPPRHARQPRHARTRPAGPGMTGTVGRVTITIRASTLTTPAAQPGPGSPLTVQRIAPRSSPPLPAPRPAQQPGTTPMLPPAAAPTPSPPMPTGPRRGSASTSPPATAPAGSPPAASPPGAPTWTTPSPGTKAEPPVRATSAAAAAPTTRSRRCPAGTSTNPAPAPSAGPHPPAAPTAPNPTPTPSS